MKIRIITIHCIPNFGSVFQSYALCRYLKDNGYDDVALIDYFPPYFRKAPLKSRIGQLLNYRAYKTRTNKFREFVKDNIPITGRTYYSADELGELKNAADVFIAGGDQLWNVYHTCGNDDAYKLTFAEGKKISYSTSLGQTDFTDSQLDELANKLKAFSAVSVREKSSVPPLKKKNISAVQCADPVFLLDSGVYNRFCKPINQPKYLLVYLVMPSELLERSVKFLSEKYGLKVILCSGFSKKCSCDLFLKDLGPDEILSYIKNAEIVLSSSFHATAFSVIFQRQFFCILPDAHTNERITDLLDTVQLAERIITEKSDLETALSQRIEYGNIKGLEENISASKKYLKDSLEEV